MARTYETLTERNRDAAPTSGAPVKMWTRGVPVEDLAAKQLANTASLPFIYKWLAVMPDVHFGKGSTIGSVIPTKGAIIPAAVGVDIGCGMMAWQLTLSAKDLPDNLAAIRTEIERAVPHGFVTTPGRSLKGGWETVPNSVASRWRNLDERYNAILAKHPKISHKRPMHQLGSLGTGNHFIELCLDEKDVVWVMLHSGSRGPGNQIGQYFIERAKAEMRTHFINLPDTDLAYLCEGTSSFDDYIEALMWAQEYAFENRQAMMDAVLRALRLHLPPFQIGAQAVNCHHNYVAREEHFGENILVTRKGAVRAAKDVMGIIPGSMGAKSFIVRGKGNVESFCSCSHGAGRVMSRNEAKRRFTLADHARDTAGVECRKDAEVIDETPKAYKDIDAVMAAQSDLVEIVHTLRQVVCVKG
jgi:tRNA-splicing ligase RtcB (3'-phosphate/5'-hydroxy nucleic acid ligase)